MSELKTVPPKWSVLYVPNGGDNHEIQRIGPYDSEDAIFLAAQDAYRRGEFRLTTDNVYLLKPDHTLVALGSADFSDPEDAP